MGMSGSRDSSHIVRFNDSGIIESINEENELSDVAEVLNYLILR